MHYGLGIVLMAVYAVTACHLTKPDAVTNELVYRRESPAGLGVAEPWSA